MSFKKVLITGGFGFIGTNLSNLLLASGFDLTVVDCLHPQIHKSQKHFLSDRVHFHLGDIRNDDLMKPLIEDTDFIIHLAADTGTNQSENEIFRYTDNNICGTSKILDILNCSNHHVRKLILASSRAIYGDGVAKKESDISNPTSVYGITKEVQEKLIMNSCPVDYTILRFQNVYGPFQSLDNPYTGILSIFFKKMSQNEDVEIFDNDLATRDFVFVSDVVDAIFLSMVKENVNAIYNVGTGEQSTILSVAERIKELIHSHSNIRVTDFHRKGDVLNVSADISKIIKELNWKPKVQLFDGLDIFLNWTRMK